MSDFNKVSLFQKRRMAIDELANYYAETSMIVVKV